MEQAYKELLKKYNSLLEENRRLKTELALLKGEDGLSMPESETATELSSSTINKYSSSKEKINLFRSLFKGREDVFARRWYSKTLDKNGYQPVCENEWNEEYCDKKKYKCSDCPNRKLMSLTDNDIYRHLSGKDFSEAGKLEDWVHSFLLSDGHNKAFSDGLKLFDRYCLGPYTMSLSLFSRCCGPEENMKYQVNAEWFEKRVQSLKKTLQSNDDMPPLIVHYVDHGFELCDGNHRFEVLTQLSVKEYPVIVWITEKDEYEEFVGKYTP